MQGEAAGIGAASRDDGAGSPASASTHALSGNRRRPGIPIAPPMAATTPMTIGSESHVEGRRIIHRQHHHDAVDRLPIAAIIESSAFTTARSAACVPKNMSSLPVYIPRSSA